MHGPHGGPGPHARPEGARRCRHRHGRRDEEAPQGGHREVRGALRRPDGRHGGLAREAVVTGRPATIEPRIPDELEPAIVEAREASARRARGQAHMEQGRVGLGRPRRARDRRIAWAGSPSATRCSTTRTSCGEFVGLGQGGRLHRRGAPRNGRLEPRAGGDQALVRRHSRRAAPARARLHRPGRGARPGALGGPGAHPVPRLVEVGRDDRDALAHALLPGAQRRRRQSLRGGHRSRAARWWTRPRSSGSGACSRTTRTSAGATRCSPTSASSRRAGGRERRGAPERRPGGGGRTARARGTPAPTPASGWAS